MAPLVSPGQVIYPLEHFLHNRTTYAVQVKALVEMRTVVQVASEQVTYALNIYERLEAQSAAGSAPQRALHELTQGYLEGVTVIVRECHQALYQHLARSFRRLFLTWLGRLLIPQSKPDTVTQLSRTAQRHIYTQTQSYVQRLETLAAALQMKG